MISEGNKVISRKDLKIAIPKLDILYPYQIELYDVLQLMFCICGVLNLDDVIGICKSL